MSDFAKRVVDFKAKASKIAAPFKPFPDPDSCELLTTLSKKQGQVEIQVLVHTLSNAKYVVIAACELQGSQFEVVRWVGLNAREIEPVAEALMDAYEILNNRAHANEAQVDQPCFPMTILTLPRKGGARELRVIVEDYNGRASIKLRVFERDGDRWVWAPEWAWLIQADLAEVVPALQRALVIIAGSAAVS